MSGHSIGAEQAVRAGTKGAPAPAALWQLIGARVGRTVAVEGQAAGTSDVAYLGTLRNRYSSTASNVAYVVYRRATIYTGRFRATCGAVDKTGTYTTFSTPRFGVFKCGSTPRTAADRAAKRDCD